MLHQLNLTTSLRSFCRNSSSAPPYAPLGARCRRFLDLRQKSLQICWQGSIGGAITLESRWANVAVRGVNCPQFTIMSPGGMIASPGTDILSGWTWERREICTACGYTCTPWHWRWGHDLNERLWTWIIECGRLC